MRTSLAITIVVGIAIAVVMQPPDRYSWLLGVGFGAAGMIVLLHVRRRK